MRLDERYVLGDVLLRDQGSTWYAAHDERVDRAVSIQLLEGRPRPRARRALERELRILGGSTEPALMRVYDVRLDENAAYVVMEPLTGGLATDPHYQPTGVAQVEEWIAQVGGALQQAHIHGYVHGAIAPHHLFVHHPHEAERQIKLVGFASIRAKGSRIEDPARSADLLPYTAPDLALDPRATPRADVFGLAATAYFLLTGAPPPEGELELPLAPELTPLLQRALAPRADDRCDLTSFLRGWRELREARTSSPPEPDSIVPGIAVGTVLSGVYEVRGRLGRGGFGSVLAGFDQQLERPVAIKLLHDRDSRDLEREAKAMAQVEHPNVARVFALGDFEGSPYLVMEMVEGYPLSVVLAEKGRPDLESAYSIIRQAAEGIAAVHGCGLVHGDVKPDNLIIGPTRVVVTDFGVVRPNDDFAALTRLVGTPAYLAPERVQRNIPREFAQAVDVYGLAVVAYELFTGRLPFHHQVPALLARMHVSEPVPPPSTVAKLDDHLDDVLLRALAKEPSERTRTCQAFIEELDEAVTHVREAELGRHRILVIDDDPDFTMLLDAYLEDEFPHAHVHCVPTGEAGLAALREGTFDVVLLDLDLPGKSGMDVAATLRADFQSPPPVVVLTATGSAADWMVLSRLGVRSFLVKPLQPEALFVTLRRLLRTPD